MYHPDSIVHTMALVISIVKIWLEQEIGQWSTKREMLVYSFKDDANLNLLQSCQPRHGVEPKDSPIFFPSYNIISYLVWARLYPNKI